MLTIALVAAGGTFGAAMRHLLTSGFATFSTYRIEAANLPIARRLFA